MDWKSMNIRISVNWHKILHERTPRNMNALKKQSLVSAQIASCTRLDLSTAAQWRQTWGLMHRNQEFTNITVRRHTQWRRGGWTPSESQACTFCCHKLWQENVQACWQQELPVHMKNRRLPGGPSTWYLLMVLHYHARLCRPRNSVGRCILQLNLNRRGLRTKREVWGRGGGMVERW